MIGLIDIEDLIACALWTGYVKDERPMSLLLVSAVESGKTETTVQFAQNKGLLYLTDFTAFGLIKKYLPQLLGGEIKHVIIPDLITPLSKSPDAVRSTTAFLNAFMEEGVKEIVSYNFPEGLELSQWIRGGVIAAIASGDFFSRQKAWAQVGFISRFLPVSYSYDLQTVDKIFDAIINGQRLSQDINLNFPDKPVAVSLPPEIARELKPKAKEIGSKMGVYGFRPLRHLTRLVKGRALSQGRTLVTDEDKDRILKLAYYFNLDHNKVLDTNIGGCIYNENFSYLGKGQKVGTSPRTITLPVGYPCCKSSAYCLLAQRQPLKECVHEPDRCPHITYPYNSGTGSLQPKYTENIWEADDTRPKGYGDANFPGNTSPNIAREILVRYTKEGDLVLDNMAGSGTILDMCKELNRQCISYDISPLPHRPEIKQGDARNLELTDNSVDLAFSHFPYGDMKRYSDREGDLSTMSPEQFLEESKKVIAEVHRVLKPRGYYVVLIGNQRKEGRVIDWAAKFSIMGQEFFRLRDEITWRNKGQRAYRDNDYYDELAKEYNFCKQVTDKILVFRKDK